VKCRFFATIAAVSLSAPLAATSRLDAQREADYSVLHVFTGADGSTPYGTLIGDWQGNVYGTTLGGGDTSGAACMNNPFIVAPGGCGVIYKIDRHGAESTLYQFKGGTDGAFPTSELLLDSAGNFYGTARGGGILTADSPCAFISGCGVVFKLDRDGYESVLYSFKGGADGFGVASGLIRDGAGNFYGTTIAGGIANANCTGDGPPGTCGVVYKLDPLGNETVLHAFTGNSDGYGPYGSLVIDWQGNLYGAASNGGDTSSAFCQQAVSTLAGALGCGTIFKIDHAGKFSVLHTFQGNDGGPFPDGWLATGRSGSIYGITGNGGSAVSSTNLGNGTIFKIDREGKESVVYDFAGGAEGLTSFGSVIRDDRGNLYGATFFGGNTSDAACSAVGGCGVVFRLDRWGRYTVLHTFKGPDGANPWASLYMDQHGDIYGATTAGGDATCNCGVVFKITLEHIRSDY
jgi:uncharacterized repeat protein (TIGR03803 family)